jgi:arsenate reductase
MILRNVLFLCTGNTARSVLSESILRHLGAGQFAAFSAGSQPKGIVNPFALKVLAAHGCPVDGFRSKSWSEFAAPGAPQMHFIFTVCDSAAGEACPIWPGHPASAHWGIEDPAAVEGSDADKLAAFDEAFRLLHARIAAFVALPFDALDPAALSTELKRIGQMDGATHGAPVA